MSPKEKVDVLTSEFNRSYTCQICEENGTLDDHVMCPNMVRDSVNFHIKEVIRILESVKSVDEAKKQKDFYLKCLNVSNT